MAQTLSSSSPTPTDQLEWATALPDGAVSVETVDGAIVLRASRVLQERFEELLDKRKDGKATPGELSEYDAITELDETLTDLNRVLRRRKAS